MVGNHQVFDEPLVVGLNSLLSDGAGYMIILILVVSRVFILLLI